MDPSRDNPFIRFATFWWALGTFLSFGVLILVIWFFNRQDPQTLEEVAASARYKTKEEIFKAQAAVIPHDAITAAIDTVGKQIATAKPEGNKKPENLVPGSKTAIDLSNKPAGLDYAAFNKEAAATNAPADPAAMETGKAQFLVCGACHGQNGEGGPAGPPLAGSEWVTGPVSNLILIQMRGLIGPITVAGKEHTEFVAGMTPMAYQTDEQIAGVLTYIRNSFGNKAFAVTPDQVAKFRGEVGKAQLPTAELIKPEAK